MKNFLLKMRFDKLVRRFGLSIKNVVGGGGGIRTHGTRKGSIALQAIALVHYATPPQENYISF